MNAHRTTEAERARVDAILEEVCRQFEVSRADVLSRKRPFSLTFPRQVAMTIARESTALPLKTIGKQFHRTHGDVLHAMKVVNQLTASDAALCKQVQACRKALESERP